MTAHPVLRLAIWLALLLALAGAPGFVDRALLLRGVEVACYIALAQMWNLLAGYAGLVSIGQQLYVGIGGYVLYASVIHFGLPLGAGLLLAPVIAAAAALPAALLLFRLRGAQFAIGTWVLAECAMLLVMRSDALGGASGMSLPAATVRALSASADGRAQAAWWLSVALAVGATLLVWLWLRSTQGLALTAMRDNEAAAAGLGVDTLRVKLAVYAVAAGVTGSIGAVMFMQKLRMSPAAAFSLGDWTASVIFIVVIGGIGSIEGPLIGAVVFFALREMLAAQGVWYQILLGCIAAGAMVSAPQGLWGLLRRRMSIELFAVQRRLG